MKRSGTSTIACERPAPAGSGAQGPMKVLFLLTTFPAPGKPPSMDKLYVDLVHKFAQQGHQVYVATLLEKREGEDTYLHTSDDGVKVLYVRCGNLFQVGVMEKGLTLVDLPRRFMSAIHRHYGEARFDLVIYPTPPITFAPVVRRLKRQMGCATYLVLRDIFPQNARDLGMIKDPLTYWFFRHKEQQLYAISDHIGCMSQGNIDYVLRHNSVSPSKLEILYNWDSANTEPLPPPDPDVRRKYGLEGQFVAVFGGNIGFAQGLEFLIELATLYQNRQDITFLLVGRGVLKGRIADMAAARGLRNLVMRDFVPREDFDQLLRACDVGLINLDRRFTIPNIPSKTLAYFAAELPVLAAIDAHTDYGRLLDECGAGLWSITGDMAGYQANFERLLHDPALRRRLGQNGARALRERFTLDRAYDTIASHFRTAPDRLDRPGVGAADRGLGAPGVRHAAVVRSGGNGDVGGDGDGDAQVSNPSGAVATEAAEAATAVAEPAVATTYCHSYPGKEILDITMAVLVGMVLLVPMLVVLVILRFSDEGEVWYLHERIGYRRRRFRVYKLATMRRGSELRGTADITLRNDPRVTRFGRFLRKTKINELPQLINVLMGDMSFVGWRPLLAKSFAYYPPHVQEQIIRGKPGLTGVGSIVFRDEEAITACATKPPEQVYLEDIAPYKGELELWYQRHQSLALDLKLIFLTAWVVLRPTSRLHERWLANLPPRPESLR